MKRKRKRRTEWKTMHEKQVSMSSRIDSYGFDRRDQERQRTLHHYTWYVPARSAERL